MTNFHLNKILPFKCPLPPPPPPNPQWMQKMLHLSSPRLKTCCSHLSLARLLTFRQNIFQGFFKFFGDFYKVSRLFFFGTSHKPTDRQTDAQSRTLMQYLIRDLTKIVNLLMRSTASWSLFTSLSSWDCCKLSAPNELNSKAKNRFNTWNVATRS